MSEVKIDFNELGIEPCIEGADPATFFENVKAQIPKEGRVVVLYTSAPDGSEQIYWVDQVQNITDVANFLKPHKLGLSLLPPMKRGRMMLTQENGMDWWIAFIADAIDIEKLILGDAAAAVREEYGELDDGWKQLEILVDLD